MSHDIELPPLPPPVPDARAPDADFTENVADTPERICPNCGAPAHGPYCYACGQSEKGMIRHLSEVMSEFADIVFNVDSRIFRSLWDLYLRPGYLTTEYLVGRRARYVTPFRLFFFLSILAFFSIQMAVPNIDPKELGIVPGISDAKTAEEVKAAVNEQITWAKKSSQALSGRSGEQQNWEDKEREIRALGAEQLKVLKRELDAAISAGSAPNQDALIGDTKPLGPVPVDEALTLAQPDAKAPLARAEKSTDPTNESKNTGLKINLFDRKWSKQDPLHFDWLTAGMNDKLTDIVVHMQENADSITKNPARLLAGFISVLPQTLFLVMPIFAVLLMFFYLFKRRLYMEHLLVALHSHAFIFLSILVIVALRLLADLAGTRIWLAQPLGWLSVMAWIWMFTYLLLMQKRVYRQGWIMTCVKFGMIGISYTFVLSIALVVAGLISLAVT